jgi:hypothetical protein
LLCTAAGLIAALGLFSSCDVSEETDTRPLVVVYGDSIVEESRIEITAALGSDWLTEYRAVGGTAPCDWSADAAREMREWRPHVVVTSFVGNNLTPCVQNSAGAGLEGQALLDNYAFHLTEISNAATAWGAQVIIDSPPESSMNVGSDPTWGNRAGRVSAITQASWDAARLLRSEGKAVFATDDGSVFHDARRSTVEQPRVGAQWLPCKPDGSETSSCVTDPVDVDGFQLSGGFVQVHAPWPDGTHLCPTSAPRPGVGLCAVRNIGAERYGAAIAESIEAVHANAAQPRPAPSGPITGAG